MLLVASGLLLGLWSPVSAQYVQNPFWTLTNIPPVMVKKGVPANATQVVFPPFTSPANAIWEPGYPDFADRSAVSNGVYDECGEPILYVVNDDVFDAQGTSILDGFGNNISNLKLKDFWIKWDDPSDPYDIGQPELTENFEAPIFSFSSAPDVHYLVYSDCSLLDGSTVQIAVYDASGTSPSLSQNLNEAFFLLKSDLGSQLRFAVSKESQNSRTIYVVDNRNRLTAIDLASTGLPTGITILNQGGGVGSGFLQPELELSHDGRKLVWANRLVPNTIIHFYDLPSGVHSTFELSPGATELISGLEWLPDGRLAISAKWNAPFSTFDGVSIFNQALTGLNHVANSAPYAFAMLELGVGKNLLYANKGFSNGSGPAITAINTQNASLFPAYSISQNSYDLSSGLGSGFVSGLPDQIDGEFYVYPLDCPGDDDPSPLRLLPNDSLVSPSYHFTPVITILSE